MNDKHRAAGRSGVGAVTGSKNVKAIAVRGTGGVRVADPAAFMKAVWAMRSAMQDNPGRMAFTDLGTAATVGAGGGAFTHRFSFEVELVGAVHEPVEDGVGEGRVAEVVVPMLDRKLAGDERRTSADAVVEQFEQVGALPRAHRRNGEVVDQDEIDLGDGGEAFAEAAVGVTDAEFVEQPRRAQVKRGEPLPTRLLGQCTGDEGLAAAVAPWIRRFCA